MTRGRAALLIAAVLAACANPRRTSDEREPGARPEAPDEAAEKGVGAEPGRPQAPAAPEGLLTDGTIGALQRALADRGLLRGHRRGELDEPTSAALRRFQEREGLAATGLPDRETLARLGIDPEKAYGRNEPATEAEDRAESGGAEEDR
ncbi:MAG TPA: peptidoglycan-binding domain-containing protein [Anaeromyxobacteraceae bacterium]|nr:peptidoglycan-binding domain-containing protein [Anaeromyxobacteraceae bacterium]